MNLFVGTNFGHGSAVAALNEGGNLIYAAEEGPLIREKGCDRFPVRSLQLLLEKYHPSKLKWAEGWNRWRRFIHKGVGTTINYGFFDPSYFRARLWKETHRLFAGINAEITLHSLLKTPTFVGHHLAHAFSLLPWGLPAKSLIIVSDTTAESASITILYWSGTSMKILQEVPYPHSLGAAFHQMAYHLGFYGRTGPGKLMALSAYGEPKWINEISSIYKITNKGFRFDLLRYPAWHRKKAWQKFALNTSSTSLRKTILENFRCREQGKDLARSVQDFFSFATLNIIKNSLEVARHQHNFEVRHLGLAGGSALNCHTNGYINKSVSSLGIDSVTISPWSDDPGTAIGAAVYLYLQTTKCIPQIVTNPFLGPALTYPDKSDCVSDFDVKKAAEVLRDGGIIALLSGRLEFGPRALGNRCLLGDPRNIFIKDRLNTIKGRPQFMPFAPVILEDDYSTYFSDKGSTNMAWTVKCTDRAYIDIPGGIHINGEARVQVLIDTTYSLLLRLLISFRELTGVGALLLTSLNGKDEPIASDFNTAKEMTRKMDIDGILSDFGWQAISNGI